MIAMETTAMTPEIAQFYRDNGTAVEARNDGGPAFPQYAGKPVPGGGVYYDVSGGMTLRDYFAGQAIAGACGPTPDGWSLSPHSYAEWAYQIADAMIAARASK